MGLLRKLRVLAGALVHKPFMPRPEKADLARPEKVDLDEGAKASVREGSARESLDSGTQDQDLVDSERVADLLERQKREQAG